jgi:aminocarboxymuconate-semialdehyde decarboxylase
MTRTSIVDLHPAGARVVDIHAHAVPLDLLTAMRLHGGSSPMPTLQDDRRVRLGRRLTPPVPVGLTDVTARLSAMERTGVDLQVISPWMELSPDELEPSAATAFLRHLNDGMGAIAGDRADRFRALALMDRRDPVRAAAELGRTAALDGFVGIELAAGGRGPYLHDDAWDPLWRAASQHGSLVLLHPWQAASPAGLSEAGLGDIVDNPAQSTAVVGGMILRGVFDRFPDLRVCVVHGGGFLPYQAGRFDAIARLQKNWHAGRAQPSTVLRRLYYDSLTHSPEALGWLVEFAGHDHVMLGSDYPFPTGDSGAVGAVRDAGDLDESATSAVLGGTACRLLGC